GRCRQRAHLHLEPDGLPEPGQDPALVHRRRLLRGQARPHRAGLADPRARRGVGLHAGLAAEGAPDPALGPRAMRVGEVRHPERARFGKPLEGVRVLALEQMQALPYATQLLAHLGAEVVKVEPPGAGDTGRASIPALVDDDGRSVGATYLRNNLGKRGIAIDLKQEEGRALVLRLIPHFDVVAENFRPGVLERFGLHYEAVRELAPRVVYVSISGFGHTEPTPYGSWPGSAPGAGAMAGVSRTD